MCALHVWKTQYVRYLKLPFKFIYHTVNELSFIQFNFHTPQTGNNAQSTRSGIVHSSARRLRGEARCVATPPPPPPPYCVDMRQNKLGVLFPIVLCAIKLHSGAHFSIIQVKEFRKSASFPDGNFFSKIY